MPPTRVRVVGSGFTVFKFMGQPIAFLDQVTDSGQPAIGGDTGRGWEAITPLGAKHPVEIATSRVVGAGTLTCTVKELWDNPVWHSLGATNGVGAGDLAAVDGRPTAVITDVWERLSQLGTVTCDVVIFPPGDRPVRGKTYNGCVVTGIDDGEAITVGALSVNKTITIAYTYVTPYRGSTAKPAPVV